MPTVIDSLIVQLGLDPKEFTKGQKEAAKAALKSQKDIEKAAAAQEKAASKAAKEIEKSAKQAEAAQKKAAKEIETAQKKAAREADKQAKGIANAQDKASESVNRLARNALKLFAIFTAGRAVGDFVSQITSADSALGRLATRIGQTPGDISALATAVQRTGGSAEAAQGSFQRFSDSIQELKTTGNTSILPFLYKVQAAGGRQINLNKDISQTYEDLAENLKNINDTQGAATANYMGKQLGLDEGTIALLVKGRAAYRSYIEESKRLGIAAKADTDAAQNLQTSIRTLTQASEGLGRTVLTTLTPTIVELLKPLEDWIKANRDWLATEITARVREFGDYLKTIDWASIGRGIRDFISGANDAAKAIGGWKVAAELFFGLWAATRIVGLFAPLFAQLALVRLTLLRMGPIGWGLLGLGALAGALASADPNKAIVSGGKNVAPNATLNPGDELPGAGPATPRSADSGGPGLLRRGYNRVRGWFGGGDEPTDGIHRRGRRARADYNLDGTPGSKEPIGGATFRDKAPGVMKRLMSDFGLNKEEAAVVLGNLGHESAGFKAFEEGGGGPGRGWAQWTDPGRKRRFFEYAQKHGLDPKSDEANYGFLKWELENTHKSAIDALKAAPNRGEKMRRFERIFEGAGVKAYGSRNKYADAAERAYDDSEKAKPAPAPAPAAPAAPAPAAPSSPAQVPKAPAASKGGTLAERAAASFEYGPQTGYPNSRSLKQMNEWLWNKQQGPQPIDWKQDKDTGNWKPVFAKPSAWNGIPNAASFVAQAQSAQAAMASNTSNDNRSSVSNETRFNGPITVQTAATDANGIARDMEGALRKRSFAMGSNYGQT